MNHLWTPWRMEYISDKHKRGNPASCIFCVAASQPEDDLAANVIARSSHTLAILNRYPYTYGHTMLVPFEHVASLEDLSAASLADLMTMSNSAMRALRAIADPPGFNIGANIGAAAGAGIAAHFHFHVVPRWQGDANFMLTVGGAQTVADTLTNIARQMREIWESLDESSQG